MTVRYDKAAVRAAVLAARRAIPKAEREAADAKIVEHAVALVAGRTRVVAFLPMAGEPGGPTLVTALAAVVETLLLPVVLADLDLDWARHDGSLAPSARPGLTEPAGPRLGPAAVAGADLLLVPAVAVDHGGVRLGRGGGSYDRALARVTPGTPIVAVLYDPEVIAMLPAQPHDRSVTAVLTPSGVRQLPASSVQSG